MSEPTDPTSSADRGAGGTDGGDVRDATDGGERANGPGRAGRPDRSEDDGLPEYGETWVYESIVGAVPGVDPAPGPALALQFVVFEAAVLGLAAVYGLWDAALAGSVAVGVATLGSVAMLRIGRRVRSVETPAAYRDLLFAASIEVVLSLFAFVGLVTYLFVVDPRSPGPSLLRTLFGSRPPAPAVFVTLLLLWDLCYRIGTGWWASVAAVWRSSRIRFDAATARELARADLETLGFASLQLALVPFVLDHPPLLAALVGHVAAVAVVTTVSVALLRRYRTDRLTSP